MFVEPPTKQQRKSRRKESQSNAPRISMFCLYNSGGPHIFWCLRIYVRTEPSIFCSRFFLHHSPLFAVVYGYIYVWCMVYGGTEALLTVQLPLQFYFHISAWSCPKKKAPTNVDLDSLTIVYLWILTHAHTSLLIHISSQRSTRYGICIYHISLH